MKRIIWSIICIYIFVISGIPVRAEETGSLEVNITQESGESVLVKPGYTFYTAVPVTFTVPGNSGENYYSISTDSGFSFGTYVKMDSDSVMLYPDDETAPDGKWQIRFANVSESIEKDSEVYRICFDVIPPVIELNEDGFFKVRDNTGILRYIVRIGDETADSVTFDEGEPITDHESEIRIKGKASYGDIIEIICEDLAGNKTVISYEYKIDENAPELMTEGISDGEGRNTAGTIKAFATDKETECYVNYICERISEDELITTSEYNLPGNTEITFDEDGIYTVVLYATDRAQNESKREKISFAIDRIPPGIDVGGVFDGVDIKTGANISIAVEDQQYEETEVNINLIRKLHEEVQNIQIDPYFLKARCDEREVNIIADGDYELHVSAKDGIGNTAEKNLRFRIDKTAPEISVTGIKEGEITNEKSGLRFSAGELFYGSTVMSTLLEKNEAGRFTEVSSVAHVMRSATDHIDVTVDSEGEYRLTCTASDRSGNTACQTVSFAVDYTPPVISEISGYDGKFMKSFSLAKRIADYVSDASGFSASAYLNDAKIQKGDVVIEEGKYFLTILAEDAASNASEKTVSFVVDHTAPQVVLSGFDQNGNIRKGSIIRVSLLEKEDTLTSVKFNGRNISVDSDNTATVAVNEYGKYELEVKAEDRAGNVTDTKIGTECYMYGGVFDGYTVEEKTISASPAQGEDIDIRGLFIGLASVLSGTFGLTYRTYLSGRQ